jgi:hypothetical protein
MELPGKVEKSLQIIEVVAKEWYPQANILSL